MKSPEIRNVVGTAVPYLQDNVDTDQIIPARFMKCVTFDGLEKYLFHDVRFHEDGKSKDCILNDPQFSGASIFIAGDNFGCGSSREHAPQALFRSGVRAIIAPGFADIFYGNCQGLGMPCVTLTADVIRKLADQVVQNPGIELCMDLEREQILVEDERIDFEISSESREAFLKGSWDIIFELLENADLVEQKARELGLIE